LLCNMCKNQPCACTLLAHFFNLKKKNCCWV
jgi:hypothetical protein